MLRGLVLGRILHPADTSTFPWNRRVKESNLLGSNQQSLTPRPVSMTGKVHFEPLSNIPPEWQGFLYSLLWCWQLWKKVKKRKCTQNSPRDNLARAGQSHFILRDRNKKAFIQSCFSKVSIFERRSVHSHCLLLPSINIISHLFDSQELGHRVWVRIPCFGIKCFISSPWGILVQYSCLKGNFFPNITNSVALISQVLDQICFDNAYFQLL